LYDQNAVNAFGWIEKVVHWDDVSVANNLLSKADDYLSDLQFDTMTIELSALDLHYLNPEAQAINLYDNILVKSVPHGLVGENGDGKLFPVLKLEIPLDNPSDTLFTLGTDIKTSLTDVNNKTNTAILQKIEDSKTSVLDEAKQDASAIMNRKFTGYVTVVNDDETGVANAIYISNTPDYHNTQTLWRWNMAGLGYTSDGGTTWDSAITIDGKIHANFITAGTMSADRIRTGKIVSVNGKSTIDHDAGTINTNNKFVVDANGNLTASNASVNGTFFAGSNESDRYWVQLTSDGKLTGGKGSSSYGYVDYSASIHHTQGDTYDYGIKMVADWLYLSHNGISVRPSNSESEIASQGGDGTLHVITSITSDGQGGLSWTGKTIRFIHGIMCSDIS
jgi:hypothetical protein